jgi:hypothetical protein
LGSIPVTFAFNCGLDAIFCAIGFEATGVVVVVLFVPSCVVVVVVVVVPVLFLLPCVVAVDDGPCVVGFGDCPFVVVFRDCPCVVVFGGDDAVAFGLLWVVAVVGAPDFGGVPFGVANAGVAASDKVATLMMRLRSRMLMSSEPISRQAICPSIVPPSG